MTDRAGAAGMQGRYHGEGRSHACSSSSSLRLDVVHVAVDVQREGEPVAASLESSVM